MRRLKTVEELNMEQVVELTVEEKTQAFKEWVNQRVANHENSLSITISQLNFSLYEGEPLSDRILNNKFELEYSFINDDVKEAIWRCEVEQISEDALNRALSEFKQMKNKVKKTKAEYKQKFSELNEAIAQAKADEDYVGKIRNLVQDTITDWCNTYVIRDCCRFHFEDSTLPKTVAHLTDWILSIKLNPSDEDVEKHIRNHMEHYTETVAVTEVQHSQEYNRCEVEIRSIRNSVNNLIWSVQSILEQVIPDDVTGQLKLQYIDSLKKTLDIAVEDVENLIQKNNVTDEDEINSLRAMLTELMDNSLLLQAQG